LTSSGKLSVEDWETILYLLDVCLEIDESKRIGHLRALNKKFNFGRKLLVQMGKEVQKIVFRSARRKIIAAVGQHTDLT
jgi:hypothetical protein